MTLNFGNTVTCKQSYYESNILDANTINIEEMEILDFIKDYVNFTYLMEQSWTVCDY
ncbi:3660_t:CDS:2 [Funneliformis mosseae]|uniref:3660_t:CDS:1 n=1 Tax=Funneliformis mosseae TaxID=27381 RepID=A0A9N9GRK6_FUNMO|nr:3660_t:CDS:2 [Funneliformis mosseae]